MGPPGGFGSRSWKRTTSLTFETPTIARKEAIRRLKVKLRNGYTVKKGNGVTRPHWVGNSRAFAWSPIDHDVYPSTARIALMAQSPFAE